MAIQSEINGYELSRKWFDFCFENPEKINPNHTALYFFAIEHCNRLGWKRKFGLPTSMSMEAIGIKSYNTYKKTLLELIDFGFIEMLELSKNQYSSNVIALSNFDKALDKALDKAMIKHTTKQRESTRQSNDSIDKQVTTNKEPLTLNQEQDISSKKIFLKNSGKKIKMFSEPEISEEIQMPFTSENFRVLWQNWKSYRHQEFKKKYKSIQSEQASLSHLVRISGGNEKTATEIITQSIANQWQGLFELKNSQNGTYQNKQRNGAEVSTQSAFSKIDSMPD